MSWSNLTGFVLAIALLASACDPTGNPREKAAAHLAKGDLAAARIEAANAIGNNEQDHEAYLILARVLIAQGDFVAADGTLSKAARLKADPAQIDRLRLRVLLKTRSYTRLLREIVPGPAHQGELLGEILAARGQAQLAMGQLDAARASFADASQVAPAIPGALLGRAQFANIDGKPKEAMDLVEQVIAGFPEHAGAWQLKGTILRLQGETNEAIRAFERAAAADPTDAEANLAAAEMLIQAGRPDAAQKHVDKVGHRSPNALLLHHVQALIHFERKEYDKAMAATQEVLRVKPDLTAAVLLAGATHLARGELNQAEDRLRPLMQSRPHNVMVRRLLATTLLRKGNARGALDALQPALAAHTEDSSLLNLAAEAHVRLRDFTKATALYERIASLHPGQPEPLTQLGLARLAEGDTTQGLATLEKAAMLSTDSIRADAALAIAALNRRDFAHALAAAQRMQSKAPHNPIGFNLTGIALIGLNEPTKAQASFERAAELDPGYWPAASNLLRLDLAAGRRDAARRRIEHVLANEKNSVEAMTALLQITGDRAQFIESLEVARRADPKALAPRHVLARVYLDLKLPDRALPIAREIAAAAPGQPAAIELLGVAQLASGRASEALTTFRELAARAPKSSLAHVRLAQTASALGDSGGAERAYRKALDLQPNDPAALAGLAGLHARSNRLADAMRIADQLKRAHPKSARGDTLIADLLQSIKRHREAIKAYEAAFAIEPSGMLVIKRHAAAAANGDKPGVATLMQWLAKFPNDLMVLAYLADQRYIAGEYRGAIELYEKFIKADPYQAAALNNLASAYLKQKDRRALSAARAAHDLKPDDVNILDTLGAAEMRYGYPAAAVEIFRKVIARLPESAESRMHYALALAKTGDKASARMELQRLVASGKQIALDAEAIALLESQR